MKHQWQRFPFEDKHVCLCCGKLVTGLDLYHLSGRERLGLELEQCPGRKEKKNMNLYEYAVIYNPGEDSEESPEIIVPVTSVLAKDQEAVKLMAARKIPMEYEEYLDNVEIKVRPF